MRIPLLILVILMSSACAYDGQKTQTRVYTGSYYMGYGGGYDPFFDDPFYRGFGAYSAFPYYMRPDWRATHMYPRYHHRHHTRYNGHRFQGGRHGHR